MFLFHFELTSHSVLTRTRTHGGPYMGPYRSVSTGFDKWWQNIGGQEEAKFTLGTLLCGLEFLGAAWESGIHVFSIDQMNERKTNLPRAQSIYQIMGEAPWGRIRKSWPEVVVLTQPPEVN
jgi:hypothetical protein